MDLDADGEDSAWKRLAERLHILSDTLDVFENDCDITELSGAVWILGRVIVARFFGCVFEFDSAELQTGKL